MDVNQLINKLKNLKLTKEQQQYVVLAVVAVAASVYSYWNFLLKPLNAQQEHWTKQVKTKTENLQKARDFKKNWADFEARLSRVQAGEQFVARRIVTGDFISTLSRVAAMTLESGVEMAKYQPDDTASGILVEEGIYKNTASVDILGTFHQVGAFLSRLSGEEIIYNVEDVQLAITEMRPSGNEMGIKASMKLLTYTGKPVPR